MISCPCCGYTPTGYPQIILKADQHCIFHDGESIKLTKGQFLIVEQLVNNMGKRNLTADELLNRLYQLDPDPPMPKTIVTQMSKAQKELRKIGLHIKNTFAAGYFITTEQTNERKHPKAA